MYDSFTFGTVLKETRIAQNLSQKTLAKDICSQAMLSRIENNEVIPSVILMKELCERLDVSLDYVLATDYDFTSSFDEEQNEWLELMKFYHQSTQYQQLQRILDEMPIFDSLKSTNSQQAYFFYAGCCAYFFHPYSTKSLNLLQQGLNLTYQPNQGFATDMEIMLLSEIGKIETNLGNTTRGMILMTKSIDLFYEQNNQRSENQLAKIFYNIATIYIDLRKYKKALDIINQGITWSSRHKNYYYLDELFLLKGIVSQDHDLIEEAIKFVQLAETLKSMTNNSHLISESRLRKICKQKKSNKDC